MQILLSAAALDRVRDRLLPLAQGHELVTLAAPDRYQRDGRDIDPAEVNPHIIWSTLDLYRDGLLPALVGKVLQSPAARWMQTFNAGLDSPVFKQIMAKGVRITKSNAQAIPIAEYVVGHGVSLILPIDQARALQAARDWKPTPYREISQTRWTLIGFGSIGREIAQRIKPFGVHLTVIRRHPAADPGVDQVADMSALPQVLPQTDVVVLACALTDETRHLAGPQFFAALKPGAILINIGRGGLVDEDALKVGLDQDRPAHAVLDVFQTEPLPTDHWLWGHPKVRVTAHTSNSGLGTPARGDTLFLTNLPRFLAGEPLLNEAQAWEVGL